MKAHIFHPSLLLQPPTHCKTFFLSIRSSTYLCSRDRERESTRSSATSFFSLKTPQPKSQAAMSSSTQTQPLASRSTNTHLTQSSTMLSDDIKKTQLITETETTAEPKPTADLHSMDFHRKALQEKLQNGGTDDQYVLSAWETRRSNNASYVSPSDDIMSPCTKKLSDLKGKRFKNAGKPTSLFAKLGKKNFEQSSSSSSSGNPAVNTD